MHRRDAIRSLLLTAGGTLLIPACRSGEQPVSIPLNSLPVNRGQENLLEALVDTIIPATDTPGARELGVHQFVLVMADDCLSPAEQQEFIAGLEALDRKAKDLLGRSFAKASETERLELVQGLESGQQEQDALHRFYRRVRGLTIQGYLKSQYVMSNLLVYELVPGRFKGSVPVSDKNRLVQNG